MKKIIFIIQILIFLTVASEQIFASATSMGHTITVGTDYSLDVLRNPALLPLSNSKSSMGFYVLYNPLYEDSTTIDVTSGGADPGSVKSSADSVYNHSAELYLAYSRNYGDYAWGVALGSGGFNQFKLSRSVSERTFTSGGGATQHAVTTEQETMEISPSINGSLGFKLTNRDYAGIKVTTIFTNEITDKVDNEIDDSPFFKIKEFKNTRTVFELMVALGYLHKFENADIGLMIRFGKLAFTKESLDYYYNQTGPVSYEGDDATSWMFAYTQTPSIACGVKSNQFGNVSIVLEADFYFPNEFSEESISFNTGTGTTDRRDIDYISRMIGSVRGGIELQAYHDLFFSIGGGVVVSQLEANSEELNISTLISSEIYYGEVGFDYFYTRSTILFGGIQYGYIVSKNEVSVLSVPVSTVEAKVHSLEVFFGMSFGL